MGTDNIWNPHNYGINSGAGAGAVHDREEIWEQLVKPNFNIRFVFSGHVLNDGCGTLVSTNNAGKPVYQLLANYQTGVEGSENGGNGYFRKVTIDFAQDKLIVKTYSAYPGVGDHPDASHNFEISPPSFRIETDKYILVRTC